MVVRHVRISRFRGIKELSWPVGGRMVCLVGPGDSTKTTILDAIELALAPRWPIQFSDLDFYDCDCKPDNPIEIEVTVAELPEELLKDGTFGLLQRGWDPERKTFRDDPEDDCEGVLTVKLSVDDSLEPKWKVVKPSNDDEKEIGWRDRQKLGVVRLGTRAEQHLSWGRTSALSRLTLDWSHPGLALALVQREAQKAFDEASLPELNAGAEKAKEAAEKFGLEANGEYHPGLDPGSLSLGQGALALYDGKIPVRAKGLGSRRLTAIALQQSCVKQGAIVLIDEVEHGLDPHRIRRLLRNLKDSLSLGDREKSGEPPTPQGQVLVTTHSPVAVRELSPEELRITRSSAGVTEIVAPAPYLKNVILKDPEAILARKIVVCEGATEVGFYVALGEQWGKGVRMPLACKGVVPINGGSNTEGPKAARELKKIHEKVMYFGDSDKALKPSADILREEGVAVTLWPNTRSIEECVAQGLPWCALKKLIQYVLDERPKERVFDRINEKLPQECPRLSGGVDDWPDTHNNEDAVRQAIGTAAKKLDWFKTYEGGRRLGEIVGEHLAEIGDTDLGRTIQKLENWAYAE